MGIFRGGRLRRLALVMSLGVLTALSIAGATSARVDDGSSGSAPAVRLAEQPEFVTFCHVAGRGDDPANTVTLTLPSNAVFGQGGHFDEGGTPNAGHEQDYLGPCQPPPPPTDVCPNIDGNQATVPAGLIKDEEGNCVTPPPPPTDVCPNIDGNQATVPSGMVKDEQGNCVAPPTDVCPNIAGNQAEVPDGLVKDEQGNCVTPPPTGVERLVVTKTAVTSWYKIYTWDVEKSVDKSQLALKHGEAGGVEWTVDVTQTGWTARNMVVSGTITVANPNGTAVTGVSVTDQLPNAFVYCASSFSSDLIVPAHGSITCIYAAPLGSTQGGTNVATAVGSLDGVDVSASGTTNFTFSETPNYEINKTVKAVDGENTWSDITGTTSFTYDEEFPCSSQGRTNVVDLLGDNPSTEQVETDSKLDTDSASVTVRCSESPPAAAAAGGGDG